MFQFGGFPFSNENDPNGSGSPIRKSPDQRLLAPTRSNIAAWHVLRRLPSRAIPQVAWICRVLATQSSGMRMIRQSSALQRQSVPFSARTCATSPKMCDHRRVHGFTSYEALPQYRMWYLRFPTSLTGFSSLERLETKSLPGSLIFDRHTYIRLSQHLVYFSI